MVGRVEHYAGDQMYIDFAGDKLEVVDEASGECRSAEVFVAILACSHYTSSTMTSLEKFNGKQMSNRKEYRRGLFEDIEKDYLLPFPPCGIR